MQCANPLDHSNPYSPLNAVLNATVDLNVLIEQLQNDDPALKTLDLKSYELSDEGVLILTKAIALNKHLVVLDLSENQIEPGGVRALSNMLKSNTGLTELRMANCQLGRQGVEDLVPGLVRNIGLTTLDLSDNDIDTDGAAMLAEALKLNGHLKALDLTENPIGEGGGSCLWVALQRNSSLTHLTLNRSQAPADAPLSDETLFNLTNSLARNRRQTDVTSVPTVRQAYQAGLQQSAACNFQQAHSLFMQAAVLAEDDLMASLPVMEKLGYMQKLGQAGDAIRAANTRVATGVTYLQERRYQEAQLAFIQALDTCRDHLAAQDGLAAAQRELPLSEWVQASTEPRLNRSCVCNLV